MGGGGSRRPRGGRGRAARPGLSLVAAGSRWARPAPREWRLRSPRDGLSCSPVTAAEPGGGSGELRCRYARPPTVAGLGTTAAGGLGPRGEGRAPGDGWSCLSARWPGGSLLESVAEPPRKVSPEKGGGPRWLEALEDTFAQVTFLPGDAVPGWAWQRERSEDPGTKATVNFRTQYNRALKQKAYLLTSQTYDTVILSQRD